MQPILSRASLMGHPLHPALIHFPVAALIALVGADFAFIVTGDPFWARASVWLVGVGTAGGWLSGSVGLIDLVTVYAIRRLVTAWSHAILAVMVLSLSTLNWLIRLDDVLANIVPWGFYVSILTALLISLTSYLGGQLVYEYAIGVDVEEAPGRRVRLE